ncbi:hypothetical protein ACW5R3_08570 [Bizionia sp. KMM 8389]
MSKSPIHQNLQSKPRKYYQLKIGDLYFYDDFALIEYAENTHVSIPVVRTIIRLSQTFYPIHKPFGLIVNKTNHFTTVPSDAFKLENELKNLVATAVVTWDSSLSINFELENYFFKKINRQLFPDLKTAEKWLLLKVEAAKN